MDKEKVAFSNGYDAGIDELEKAYNELSVALKAISRLHLGCGPDADPHALISEAHSIVLKVRQKVWEVQSEGKNKAHREFMNAYRSG
jgi:hypothetical protein